MKIFFKKNVEKTLRKLDKIVRKRFFQKISYLKGFPNISNYKKLKGGNNFQCRIGNFRILFYLEDECIFISEVEHRSRVYKNL